MTAPAIADIHLEELEQMSPPELLTFAFEQFGERAAIGTSLQKTGMVIIDMASRLGIPFRVFFVDTLLNHRETYDLLEETEKRYAITIERFTPSPDDIDSLHRTAGQWAHFLARTSCCRIRKVLPFQRAQQTLDVWVSGLRADQSDHRDSAIRRAEWVSDAQYRRILKLNPLLTWTIDDIDRYTSENNLPYNKLYDFASPFGEKYTVIGCECCHIPIRDGLPPRLGKFPWEQGTKECGLHEGGSGI
ncbi:MAG: phosphoadenylyl-sulfate reductase [Planctomycetota bacterium]|jgi:phosphoadenylyl-sulfate reductase (thioredoxin)